MMMYKIVNDFVDLQPLSDRGTVVKAMMMYNIINDLIDLQPLSDRGTEVKAMMMYNIINDLVDLQPREDTLKSNTRPSRGHQGKLMNP